MPRVPSVGTTTHGQTERRAPLVRTPAEEDDRVDRTTLALLLDRERPWPWPVLELERELGEDLSDGLARLYASGLIWRRDGFMWPTQAAIGADELQL